MAQLDDQAQTGLDFGDEQGGDESAVEKEFGDPFAWQDAIVDMLEDEFLAGAVTLGWDERLAEGWFGTQKVELVNYLQDEIVPTLFGGQNQDGTGIGDGGVGFGSPESNIQNLDTISKFARQWLSAKAPQVRDAFFPNISSTGANPPRGGGGGGRRGPVKPTPEQIRNQFDIDQLSAEVSNMWRGKLLTKAKDPRGIAKAYVEAVVQTGGEKKIDFQTFVDQRIQKDRRYKTIYGDKPPSLSDEQFLQPYLNSAMQVMRPQNAGEVARAGAQLGSSPGAFRERLGRSEETTGSAPFVSGMEARMTDLGKVFRG